MKINGKEYPLWSQFVERKKEFIGLRLQEITSGPPETGFAETQITDITLKPNGKDSAFFSVDGEEFDCGFDVGHGGIGAGEKEWITFHGYGGHEWRIESK